jgi:hypothetical protein
MTGDDEVNPLKPSLESYARLGEFEVELPALSADGDLAALPEGAPDDFFARLSLALKTTDAEVLVTAAQTFCGVHQSAHEYICHSIGAELPAHLDWLTAFLLAHAAPSALLAAFERGKVAVWVVPADDVGRVMVLEALREGRRPYTIPVAGQRLTVFLEPHPYGE